MLGSPEGELWGPSNGPWRGWVPLPGALGNRLMPNAFYILSFALLFISTPALHRLISKSAGAKKPALSSS